MNSNLTGDQKALWTRLMDDSRTRMASKKDRLFKHECNDANGAKYAEGKAPKSEFCDGQSGKPGFQAGKLNKHLQQLDAGTFSRRKACPRLAVTPDAMLRQ